MISNLCDYGSCGRHAVTTLIGRRDGRVAEFRSACERHANYRMMGVGYLTFSDDGGHYVRTRHQDLVG